MSIHPEKSKCMHVSFNKTEPNFPILSINSNIVSEVNQIKLLGVVLSNNLKWDAHINEVLCKSGKRLYMLIRLKKIGYVYKPT